MRHEHRRLHHDDSSTTNLQLDWSDSPDDAAPLVVAAPPFGVAADALFVFSHHLVENGLKVARLDYRNHVGESSGSIDGFTLSAAERDLALACVTLRPDAIMAFSLVAWPALRVASRFDLPVVFVVPVFDVRATLHQVFAHDYFSDAPEDVPEHVELFGHALSMPLFLEDCAKSGIQPASASPGMIMTTLPQVEIILADADEWVDSESLSEMVAALEPVTVTAIVGATHQISRNPAVAREFILASTRACASVCGLPTSNMRQPSLAETIDLRSKLSSERP